MIFHPFLQYFRRHIFAILIHAEPGRKLRMPNQRMSCDCQMIFLSKSNKFICLCEIITVLLRMHFLTLHTILCYNSIKLFLNYAHSCLIPTGCLSCIHCCSYQEFILQSFFQSLCFLCKSYRSTSYQGHSSQQRNYGCSCRSLHIVYLLVIVINQLFSRRRFAKSS